MQLYLYTNDGGGGYISDLPCDVVTISLRGT